MKRVLLLRRGRDAVEAREFADDGAPSEITRLSAPDVVAFVRDREATQIRWVWNGHHAVVPGVARGRRAGGAVCRSAAQSRRAAPVALRRPGASRRRAHPRLGQPATGHRGRARSLFPLDDPADRLDPAAEFDRQRRALAASTQRGRLTLLLAAESAGALAAAEMTSAGLPWRADVHQRLLTRLLGPRPVPGQRPEVLERLAAEIRTALAAPGLNPDSPAGMLRALQAAGLPVTNTRSWTLEQVEHPGIPALLEYKKLSRLLSANDWSWLETWARDGRFRSYFVPGGVVTGRWASNGGGALSVPVLVRPAAVADDGWRLVVADVAQLEPRVLAGMSGDTAMAGAARASDLYQGMVDSGAVNTRAEAKVGMLGAMYGGTRGESGRMMPRLTRRYPHAIGLVEAAARAGARGEVVHTLLGRGSPSPSGAWTQQAAALGEPAEVDRSPEDRDRRRRAWGRFTRNFVVQGAGAEWALCWLAEVRNRLWRLAGTGTISQRPHLVFFLHDEVLVHTPEHLADAVAAVVRDAAVEAGRLLFGAFPVDFPLDVAVVRSWADAG